MRFMSLPGEFHEEDTEIFIAVNKKSCIIVLVSGFLQSTGVFAVSNAFYFFCFSYIYDRSWARIAIAII